MVRAGRSEVLGGTPHFGEGEPPLREALPSRMQTCCSGPCPLFCHMTEGSSAQAVPPRAGAIDCVPGAVVGKQAREPCLCMSPSPVSSHRTRLPEVRVVLRAGSWAWPQPGQGGP